MCKVLGNRISDFQALIDSNAPKPQSDKKNVALDDTLDIEKSENRE